MSEEVKDVLEDKEKKSTSTIEETTQKEGKAENTDMVETQPNFLKISKILMIIGAIATMIAPFLPIIKNPAIDGVQSLFKGIIYDIGPLSSPAYLAFIPVGVAAIIILLAIMAKEDKKKTAYLGGVLGLFAFVGMILIIMHYYKGALYMARISSYFGMETEARYSIGYYLLVIGYLFIVGGAVAAKGLDSFGSSEEDDESEKKDEESEEKHEDSVEKSEESKEETSDDGGAKEEKSEDSETSEEKKEDDENNKNSK